jgi:hypothetical protein
MLLKKRKFIHPLTSCPVVVEVLKVFAAAGRREGHSGLSRCSSTSTAAATTPLLHAKLCFAMLVKKLF